MPYTEAVLTEIQRISNVVAMTVRCPTEDVWVDGYFIAKVAETINICLFINYVS